MFDDNPRKNRAPKVVTKSANSTHICTICVRAPHWASTALGDPESLLPLLPYRVSFWLRLLWPSCSSLATLA